MNSGYPTCAPAREAGERGLIPGPVVKVNSVLAVTGLLAQEG